MRPAALLVLVAWMLVTTVDAQQSPGAPVQTFRTSTRLVQVSVVIHDNRGRTVEGLKPEDFQVLEDGREHPVSLMHVRRASSEPETAAAARGVFTNRIQNTAGGGVVALVYDRLNTSWSDQVQARDHILEFLGQIHPQDRVALYVLDSNGVQVLHDFTRDASVLIAAMSRSKAEGSRELAAAQPPQAGVADGFGGGGDGPAMADGLAKAIVESFMRTQAHFDNIRANVSLESLELIAAHLQGVPGRKNLVWVSSGFPFYIYEPGHKSTKSIETRRATRTLSHSDIAVYPVDARGLIAPTGGRGVSLTAIHEPIEGLRKAADWTGGRAFFNTNDLGAAISRAVEDSRLTYVLGYYPANETLDGRFRSIKVRVRGSGVEVRHRPGYYAFASAPADEGAKQKTMMAALESPLEATGLPMTVSARTAGAGGGLTLTIEIDPGTLTFEKRDGAWRGAIDVAIAQTMRDRQHLKEFEARVPLAADAQQKPAGVRLTRTITLRSDAEQVRIVVRDALSGDIGSVIVPRAQLR